MLNNFLFITHLTPKSKRTIIRQKLIENYFESIKNQTYKNWKVLILGEDEFVDDKFHFVKLEDFERNLKLRKIKEIYERNDVLKLINESDYIIKIDDDDVIGNDTLERYSEIEVDVVHDTFHTFYDLTNGRVTQQKRSWIASTCIHKKQHAFCNWNGEGSTIVGNLLYSDHSIAWHRYYENKKKIYADKKKPIYLRVLSPGSISSSQNSNTNGLNDFNHYLKQFGNWKIRKILGYDYSLERLKKSWLEIKDMI